MLAVKVWTILIAPAFWGLLSLLLTVAAYAWYLFDTFKKGVRPHILTWIAFGGFTAVGWLVQVEKGAGPGGWAMGVTWMSCVLVAGVSAWKQRQENNRWWKFPRKDWIWIVFAVAVFGIYLKYPNHPTVAAISAAGADLLSYGPTINQGLRDPYRDSAGAFFLNSVKFIPTVIALLILHAFSLATALYPIAVLVMNAFVVWLLHNRRDLLESGRSPKIEMGYP